MSPATWEGPQGASPRTGDVTWTHQHADQVNKLPQSFTVLLMLEGGF
jgi:hypothetical protein